MNNFQSIPFNQVGQAGQMGAMNGTGAIQNQMIQILKLMLQITSKLMGQLNQGQANTGIGGPQGNQVSNNNNFGIGGPQTTPSIYPNNFTTLNSQPFSTNYATNSYPQYSNSGWTTYNPAYSGGLNYGIGNQMSGYPGMISMGILFMGGAGLNQSQNTTVPQTITPQTTFYTPPATNNIPTGIGGPSSNSVPSSTGNAYPGFGIVGIGIFGNNVPSSNSIPSGIGGPSSSSSEDKSTSGSSNKMWDVNFDFKTDSKTKTRSPIVLDLNGDGKPNITGKNILGDGKVDGKTVAFDIDTTKDNWQYKSLHNGKSYEKRYNGEWKDDVFYFGKKDPKEQTEWLEKNGGDGFLVWDVDNDGKITSSKELFGNYDTDGTKKFNDGYQKLSQYFDKDKNGNVTGEELNGLKIWKDDNADGITQEGELKTLAECGVNNLNISNVNPKDMSSTYA